MVSDRFFGCGGERLLVREPGGMYGEVAPQSLFKRPIAVDGSGLQGRSRRWGDAAAETQRFVIEKLIDVGSREGLSLEETAFALAVVRTESGFNPDAAAQTTSAAGLGQLVKKTAANLGIEEHERFSIPENIRALFTLLKGELLWAKRHAGEKLEQFALAYARYHDGPRLNAGGKMIAERIVVPAAERTMPFVRCMAGR